MLSKEDVNTGRQIEADLAKFVCLMGMVVVHCFDVFVSFSETSSTVQYVFLFVLNSIFGAGTFMFCMGLGLAYTSGSAPKQIIRRGIRIFLLGYLLNLVCALSYLILLQDVAMFVTYLIGLDILQFAGLALIFFGLLKKLAVPDLMIGIIAVILSAIATVIGSVDLGNPAANIFCGLFFGSFDYEWLTGGIFPLFNWFIFVAAGYLFAKYVLRRCTDKNRLYRRCLVLCGILIAVYMVIAIPGNLGMMGSILRFHHIRLHEALVALAGALLALSVYHFALRIIPEGIQRIIVRVSRSINVIYCCQWVILAWAASIWVLSGKQTLPDGVIILIGLMLFVFCAVLAELFSKWKQRRAATGK